MERVRVGPRRDYAVDLHGPAEVMLRLHPARASALGRLNKAIEALRESERSSAFMRDTGKGAGHTVGVLGTA